MENKNPLPLHLMLQLPIQHQQILLMAPMDLIKPTKSLMMALWDPLEKLVLLVQEAPLVFVVLLVQRVL